MVMKIEVWSDYVCPFCYIGKKQLEMAIQETGIKDVEVEYKSYMLDPNTPEDSSVHVYDSLAKKYQTSVDQAKNMTSSVVARAQEVGLAYDFTNLMEENTLKAHRLTKWAAQYNKGQALTEAILHAHFIKGQRIGQDAVLLAIVKEVGLDTAAAQQIITTDAFTEEVHADIAESRELGVQGVPFFVIDRKYGISGAQPAEVFEQTLRKVANENASSLQMQGDGSAACDDEKCDLS